MSTIGGLLLPSFAPVDYGRAVNQGIEGGRGILQGQTNLLTLADLKRKQASEEEVMAAIRNNPALAQQLFGGGMPGQGPMPTLATLGQSASPQSQLLQQTLLPGQPPGAPQPVPGGQDLSRYAGVSPQGGGPIPPDVMRQVSPTVTPPQGMPTLATLGGQPQGPMPAPQNLLLEMARRDPRAALLLQQQMQGQQDREWKLQEQRLDIGVKVAEGIARQLQGVTDQASMEEARERVRLIHPQAAAQIPQFYSKEAVESLQQRGIAFANMAQWKKDMATTEKTLQETRLLPELFKEVSTPATAETPTGGATTQAPAGGANLPQRMNNPYNIKYGTGTQHWVDKGLAELGEKAADGGQFLKFKDPSTGEQAGLQLLQGPGYRDLTVDAAMKRWSNNGYGAEIAKDIPADTKIKDLSAAQMRPLMAAMREAEGWNARPGGGGGTAPATDPRVAQLQTQIDAGTRKAKQAAALGYESLATQYNHDVQRLEAQKTRLEAPRQAYEVKAAVAPLEKDIAASQGRQVEELKQEAEKKRSLVQVVGEDKAESYRYRDTLEPLNAAMPYGDALVQVHQNKAIPLSAKQNETLNKIQSVIPTIRELRQAMERVYGPGGIFDNLKPEDRAAAAVKGGWERFAQTNPDLAVLGRLIDSNVDVVRRALQGQVGTQTEQDAVRGTGAFPKTGNIPDSKEVAYKLMDAFQNMVQGNMRTISRNPQFTHPDLQPTTTSSGLTPAQEALLKKHTR